MANLIENHLPVVQSDGLNTAKAVFTTGPVAFTPQASTVVVLGDYGSGIADGNLAGKGSITINAQRGQIVTPSLALGSGSIYVVDLVNNKITANGIIMAVLSNNAGASNGGNTGGAPYVVSATPNVAGSATIRIGNASTVSLMNGSVTVNFIVLQ